MGGAVKKFKLTGLTRGAMRTVEFVVDIEDAPLVRSRFWELKLNSDTVSFAIMRSMGAKTGATKISLAAEILRLPSGTKILHKNFDNMDFRKSNLHVAIGDGKTVCAYGHEKVVTENNNSYCPKCNAAAVYRYRKKGVNHGNRHTE